MVYLDYSATTPVSKELLDLYVDISTNYIGNANSEHFLGKKSKKILEQAMHNIANQFDCYSKEIIFTSGASESNTMAIMGTIGSLGGKRKHIITSKLEHKSILDLMKELSINGYKIDYVNILPNGIIDLEDLEKKICDDTILISICSVNSEVGFIQPLDKIRKIIDKKKINCFFHSDLTQALGKIKIDLSSVDLASFSSHKIYAPIGCGILYKKRNIYISKLIYGISDNLVRLYSKDYDTDTVYNKINGAIYSNTNYYAVIRIPYELFNVDNIIYEPIYLSNSSDFNWYYSSSNWIKVAEIKIEEYVNYLGGTYNKDNSMCL